MGTSTGGIVGGTGTTSGFGVGNFFADWVVAKARVFVASLLMALARSVAWYRDSFLGGAGCFVGDGGAIRCRDAVPLSSAGRKRGILICCSGAAAKTRAAMASSLAVTARGGRPLRTRVWCQAQRLAWLQLSIGGNGIGPRGECFFVDL